MRTVLITSGGDWADASADLLDLPDGPPMEELWKEYRSWLKERNKGYTSFLDWLRTEKGAVESKCEQFSEYD